MNTNTNTNVLPASITRDTLLQRAGRNVTPNNVTFEHRQFDGTGEYAHKPVESIQAYERAVREDYEWTERSERYDGFTRDEISVALVEVMSKFGMGLSKITKRGAMDTPSTRTVTTGIDIITGEKSTAVVPDGATSLPGFLGDNPYIEVQTDMAGTPILHATVVRRDQGELEGIFNYVRDVANAKSIYVGQIIDTAFNFLDFSDFDIKTVAQTAAVEAALQLYVINPIRYPEANRLMGISPKSSFLLEGPPGGGKTMVVSTAIKIAALEGVTVIYVDPGHGLAGFMRAHKIANRIMSAGHMVMIVMEDMEKLAAQDRAAVLEALDGGDSKDANRIIIGTTNFVEQMDRAMLREGRFNDIIHCGLPDRQAFEHLLRIALNRKNAAGEDVCYIDDDVDFDKAWCEYRTDGDDERVEMPHFKGFSFAFISGAVQNILRLAVNRRKGDIEGLKVKTEDLIGAADAKRGHFDMMALTPPKPKLGLDGAFQELVEQGIEEHVSDMTDYGYIRDNVYDVVRDVLSETSVALENDQTDDTYTGMLRP